MDGQLGAELRHLAQPVDVVQVEGRVDALSEQIEGEGDHVHVAGPFTVAEQRALHPIGPGHDAQLGGGDGRAAVVVRVEAEHDLVPVTDGPAEPFDQIGIQVGGVHLHRGRQVEDDGPIDGRLDGVHDRLADLDRVLAFSPREALR